MNKTTVITILILVSMLPLVAGRAMADEIRLAVASNFANPIIDVV